MELDLNITNDEAREFLSPDVEPTPEHEQWIKEQVEARLAEKKAGLLTYRSLDDVMADFGFDAR